MVFKWKDDHTPLVLKLLQTHECLWDRKNEFYKNKVARENALQQFLKELNLPGVTDNDIRLKIKTIRTRYAAELRHIIKSQQNGPGINEIYKPKLFWFEQADAFLRDVCTPRSTVNSVNIKYSYTSDSSNDADNQLEVKFNVNEEANYSTENYVTRNSLQQHESNNLGIIERDLQESRESNCSEEKNNLTCQNDTNHQNVIIEKNEIQENNRRTYFESFLRKRPITNHEIIANNLRDKIQKTTQEENLGEDEFDLFCKSLAIQLKKMPLERALLCQEKLQSVMTQERLYQLQSM